MQSERSDRLLPWALGLCLAGLACVWLLSGLESGRAVAPQASVRAAPVAPAPIAPAADAAGEAPGGARPEPEQRSTPGLPVADDARRERASEPEAPAAPVRRATLAGRVVDRRGRPLAGALVLTAPRDVAGPWPLDAEAEATRTARTDAAGAFLLGGLRPGHARLAARVPGHAPLELDDVWLPLDTIEVGALVLEDGRRLDGKVVDARGRSVEGAALALLPARLPWDAERLNARAGIVLGSTDINGRFSLDQLPPGRCNLVASHPLHPELVFAGDESTRDIEVRLAPAGETRVRLEGEPTLPAVVQALPARVVLDPAWNPPAPHAAGFRAAPVPQRETLLSGLVPEAWYELQLRPAALDPEAPLAPQPAALEPVGRRASVFEGLGTHLRGRARDRDSGGSPRELTLQLVGAGPPTPAVHLDHGRGSFATEAVFLLDQAHPAVLLVGAPGHVPRWFDGLALEHGTVLELGELELHPLESFELRVADRSGEPLEGARVSSAARALLPPPEVLERARGERPWYAPGGDPLGAALTPPFDPTLFAAHTDAAGLAEVRVPAEGGVLRVEAPGYGPLEQRADELLSSFGPTAEVRLAPPGEVEVEVRAAAGAPPCVRVLRAAPGPTPWGVERHGAWVVEQAFPDATGRVVFEGLGQGPALFAALPEPVVGPEDAGELDWTAVEVRAGERVHVALAPPAFTHLVGRLALGGVPVAAAELALEWGPGRFELAAGLPRELPARARTGEDGRFRIPNLLRGAAHSLSVRLPDGTRTRRDVVADAELLELELADTRLLGAVTDAGGEPVEGLEVALRCRVSGYELGPTVTLSGLAPPVPVLSTARTDGAGWFELSAFPPGVPCELVLGGSDGVEVVPVGLGPGERQPVEVHRAASAPVDLDVSGGVSRRHGLMLLGLPVDDEERLREGLVPLVRPVGLGRLRLELPEGRWDLQLVLVEAGALVLHSGPALELEVVGGEHQSAELTWPPR